MKKVLIISLILAFVMTDVVTAQHQRDQKKCCDNNRLHHGMKADGRHKGFGAGQLLMIADEINLSDEQKDKLKSMTTEFQLKKVDLGAEIQKANIIIRDLMQDDNVSESNVFKAIDRVTSLKADMKKMNYSHMKFVKNVLSDEQKEQLKSLRKKHMEKRRINNFAPKTKP